MELYSDSNSDSSGESVDQSETAVFTKMDCAPVLHGPSKLHRDYSQPTSVERKLNREECYRGLARCKVLEGSILADRAYKFQKGDEFPIYSPITHHAISLEPIGSNAKVLFTEMDPARSHLTEKDFNDIYKGEEENLILTNFYSTEESSLKVAPRFGPEVLSKIKKGERICIIGGKGSGKSTTNRFMLNSLLNDHRTVYWLEMDPGQPEFNVSGWLSLVKVTKPRMGPNYPFLKNKENHFEIISQYYLGEFGLQQAARLYIHIIEQLVKDLNRLNPTCPVIFNAMGWLRELGLTLLRDSLNIGNIDLIYYLETKTSNDLPEDISLEEIFEERGNIIGRPLYEGNNRCRLDIPKIKDQSNSKSATHQKKQYFTRNFSPRNLRDYAYSMWINQWMEENQCITIEYKYIGINFHNSIPQNIFQVLNNCVISLGRVSQLPRIDRDGFRARAVNHNSPGGDFMSLGWGWIRHCDIESGILNIHSSLPINKLMELGVNSISVGNLPLPTAITNAINSGGKRPYVDEMSNGNKLSNNYKDVRMTKKKRAD